METRVPSFPYLAYTDEISDVMGKAGTCGDITYTLYNEDEEILGEEAIVRVKSYAGASTFYIELDTSQSSQTGLFNFTMLVEMPTWPDVEPFEREFSVNVLP